MSLSNYKDLQIPEIDYNRFYEEPNTENVEEDFESISPEQLIEALSVFRINEENMYSQEFLDVIGYLFQYRQSFINYDFAYHFENFSTFKTLNQIIGLNFNNTQFLDEDSPQNDQNDLTDEEKEEKKRIENHLLNTVLEMFICFTFQSPDLLALVCKNGFIIQFMQHYKEYSPEQVEMGIVIIQNIFNQKTNVFNNIQFSLIPIASSLVIQIFNESNEFDTIHENCVKTLANIASIGPNPNQCNEIAHCFINAFHNDEKIDIKVNALRGLSFLMKHNTYKKISFDNQIEISKISLNCQNQDEIRYAYYGFILGERIISYFDQQKKEKETFDPLPDFLNEVNYERIKAGIEDQSETLCLPAIRFAVISAIQNQAQELIKNGLIDSALNALDLSYSVRAASLYLLCLFYHEDKSILDYVIDKGFDPTALSDALESNYAEMFLETLKEMASNESLRQQMIENNILDSISAVNTDNEKIEALKEIFLDLLSPDE